MTKKNEEVTARNVSIDRMGTKIILPKDPALSYKQSIEVIERKMREEETEVAINEPIEAYPMDGAVAMSKAMQEIFGWTEMIPTPSWFGANPPTMIAVKVGPRETRTIPWGRFSLPGIDGYIEFGIMESDDRTFFVLRGIVRQKHQPAIHALAERAREISREESIYKGKALIVDFDNGWQDQIDFIDVSQVKPEELILPDGVLAQVETCLYSPILFAEEAKKHGVPAKRGILLEGKYGTGKTLTAYVAARYAVEARRTFIYVEDPQQLTRAWQVAAQYQPACVFCEDIDRIAGTREGAGNELANVLDGLTSKEAQVIIVLTTNEVEAIHSVMLRPGRLDAIISFPPPDAGAAMRLVKLFGRGLLDMTEEDLVNAGEALAGQIPAVIREAVERSKLAAIFRQRGQGSPRLNLRDILAASESLANQRRLVDRDTVQEKPDLAKIMGEAIVAAMLSRGDGTLEVDTSDVERRVGRVAGALENMHEDLKQGVHATQKKVAVLHSLTDTIDDKVNEIHRATT